MRKLFYLVIFMIFSAQYTYAQQWVGDLGGNGDIYRNGDVAIGTSSPGGYKLKVAGGSLALTTGDLVFAKYGGDQYIHFTTNIEGENSSFSRIYGNRISLGNSNLQFGTTGNGLYTTKLTIDHHGLVGIGTSLPNYTLDVSGNIGITTNTSADYVLTRSRGIRLNNYSELEFLTSTYGNNYGYRLYGEDPGRDGVTLLKIDYRSNSTSWTNAITLEQGRLGIGTTNPSEMLTVKGTVLAEEVKVTSSIPNSDYVFEPDYNLLSLHEVDAFIKQNKHLPDIPSAEEFKENGVGLGEMDDMLLRKIEELTLYVIEQQRALKELKKENEKLKYEKVEEDIQNEKILRLEKLFEDIIKTNLK